MQRINSLTTLEELYNLKNSLDDKYYNSNSESEFTDEEYDYLVECIKKKDPNFTEKIGHIPQENRVKLPIWLGSMDKIKNDEENKIENWLKKNKCDKYVIEEKLDGVSCLMTMNNNILDLFTRGNGFIGTKISHLIPYINNIPSLSENIMVRGELIIAKEIFDNKYSKDFKNMRNMVSGLIARKSTEMMIYDIDFIAYEFIDITSKKQKPHIKQLEYLIKTGFTTVRYEEIDKINLQYLVKTLKKYKNSRYDIDGIIVQCDNSYKRNTEGNPKYAFAFKMLHTDNKINTTVQNVVWNVSKWGKLKPVIEVKPVSIQGITISRVTAYNAKFIYDNKIGPGTIINITRSGDVIPTILDVIKPSLTAQMPCIQWIWDENNVEIISKEENDIIIIKSIHFFFTEIGVKDLGLKTIEVLYKNKLTSFFDIIKASPESLTKIEGFGIVKATKICNNIKNAIGNITIPLFLGASGVFGCGIGTKTLKKIFVLFNPLQLYKTIDNKELHKKIVQIPDFSDKTASLIVKNIEKADALYQSFLEITSFTPEDNIEILDETLKDKKIVFSGFRNKSMEDKICKKGGKICSKVSSKTNILIVDNKNASYSSINLAKKNNIIIYDGKEFMDILN
tara:strand:- start:557 stop:2419 length:1863 start_codon:yes stop_codon:yes gene_type:complete